MSQWRSPNSTEGLSFFGIGHLYSKVLHKYLNQSKMMNTKTFNSVVKYIHLFSKRGLPVSTCVCERGREKGTGRKPHLPRNFTSTVPVGNYHSLHFHLLLETDTSLVLNLDQDQHKKTGARVGHSALLAYLTIQHTRGWSAPGFGLLGHEKHPSTMYPIMFF